jgi:hypothetical protein
LLLESKRFFKESVDKVGERCFKKDMEKEREEDGDESVS